ncbi:hypothetical protein A3A05_00250 [Candidatus Nomurabacteria bacterium RIFCSPLOWO2_01_FULL_41_12]|uniref:Uncharacterized protein n=1 Tax=Candidatus Nomurabacteria bacterium RIFCSPLOWO2_01_FULL_41_12 TaxID=1801774 RepID=A0A1F6WX37_9BACT|nr:MAG: hypothetical protein A3A05_00250 [Candidatus Nomurabacteria bacterium RIFCSPLOWO2_01_FULL_41_12]
MDDTIDLLQIKIEKAKAALPAETINATAAVDWKAAILGLRGKHGYTFEQLGDLELETELLLCGLLTPSDYPKELENRMKISRSAANELVSEMNDLVFKKIQAEMIKNVERKKVFAKKEIPEELKGQSLNNPPRAVLENMAKLEVHPILTQKLSSSFKIPMVETDHTLKNLQPSSTQNGSIPKKPVDPYREIPE